MRHFRISLRVRRHSLLAVDPLDFPRLPRQALGIHIRPDRSLLYQIIDDRWNHRAVRDLLAARDPSFVALRDYNLPREEIFRRIYAMLASKRVAFVPLLLPQDMTPTSSGGVQDAGRIPARSGAAPSARPIVSAGNAGTRTQAAIPAGAPIPAALPLSALQKQGIFQPRAGPPKPSAVAQTSLEHKMEMAITGSPLSRELRRELGDISALIESVVVGSGALLALAATGYGAAAEGIGICLLLAGAAMSGAQIGKGINALVDFYRQVDKATSEKDLEKAGISFADGVAALGIGTLFLLLSILGTRAHAARRRVGSSGSNGGGLKVEPRRFDVELKPEPRQLLKPVDAPRRPVPDDPVGAETDPIKRRQSANDALRNTSQFQKDLGKANVSPQQLQLMNSKAAPLGFDSPEQFNDFKADLAKALKQDGLNDAQIGMKGTATTFYSENPGKSPGHFWDADPTKPGDYDLNLLSKKMAQQMTNEGIVPSQKYGIYRTADINSQFPALSDFSAKWTSTLGRDVNIVGYPADSIPVRDPTEFMLVK